MATGDGLARRAGALPLVSKTYFMSEASSEGLRLTGTFMAFSAKPAGASRRRIEL